MTVFNKSFCLTYCLHFRTCYNLWLGQKAFIFVLKHLFVTLQIYGNCTITKEPKKDKFYFHSVVMKHNSLWTLMIKPRDYEVLMKFRGFCSIVWKKRKHSLEPGTLFKILKGNLAQHQHLTSISNYKCKHIKLIQSRFLK